MKRGFTLVELSIVLVIIGLLIGGILVAQSMMSTARITKFVKQIQQYDVAVSDFKTKYGYLPGDASNFAPAGDGDGYIRVSPGPGANDYNWQGEIERFWNVLSLAENVKDSTGNLYSVNSNMFVGTNMPTTNIGAKGTSIMAFAPSVGRPLFDSINVWGVAGVVDGAFSLYWVGGPGVDGIYPSIAPSDALSIDTKMDDGVANAGNVRAALGNTGGSGLYNGPNSAANQCVLSGNVAAYNVSSTAAANLCGLDIVMLSSNLGSQQ